MLLSNSTLHSLHLSGNPLGETGLLLCFLRHSPLLLLQGCRSLLQALKKNEVIAFVEVEDCGLVPGSWLSNAFVQKVHG